MTYEDAQKTVKTYLQYDSASDATKARLDVAIPQALNNARLWAERQHDWAYSYAELWYRLDSDGKADVTNGQLLRANLNLNPVPTGVQLRSLRAAFLENADLTLSPLMVRPVGAVQRLKIQKRDLQVDDPFWPETSDSETFNHPYLMVLGRTLSLVPGTASVIKVEGFRWMSPYVNQTDTDFFLEFVPDVLIWKAVIDCNYVAQVFVNRQDGNVGIPREMLADAWESAVNWDSYQHEGGFNYQLG